jgi:cytochrome b pre-mRNA-processing protein 3
MILSLFRKNAPREPVYRLYSAIVAQSRHPRFYAELGIPDTVTGRFDMICLHLALLFRRMRGEGTEAREFSQAVFDLFFKDMDSSLREMGIGDLAIPKRIQKLVGVFYGLSDGLALTLDSADRAGLEALLQRNLLGGQQGHPSGELAEHVEREASRLASVSTASLLSGSIGIEVPA